MLTSPMSSKLGCQQEKTRRDGSQPSKAGLTSEVFLILGEPTPEDMSALLHPLVHSSRRRLLIFASDIRGLKSALQTPYIDVHILPKRLRESFGLDSQCPNPSPGEAIQLLDVLERASQFAAAWRADAKRLIRVDQLSKEGQMFFCRHDSANSPHSSDATHAIDSPNANPSIRATHATLNNVNDDAHSKLHRRYTQSNSSSKSTANRSLAPTSKGLFLKFLNRSSTSVSRLSSPSIHQPRHAILPDLHCPHQHLVLETYKRTFDAILNFLPSSLTEKSLLKQVILVSTLCEQQFPQSETPPTRTSDFPTSRAGPSRSRHPSLDTPYSERHPNPREKANALSARTAMVESNGVQARRPTSSASSGSSSASASASAPSPGPSTPTSTSASSQQRRWSMLSWLSTTSASQASDTESGATKTDICIDCNPEKRPIKVHRKLSYLFSRTDKRRSQSPQIETLHTHTYLIHVLPASCKTSLPTTPSDTISHTHRRTKNPITAEPELLEKRRNSLPLPLPSSRALNHPIGSATGSFTHARMQTSLMRRATVQQRRLRNLERRYSMPAALAERGASRTVLKSMSRRELLTRGPVQSQIGPKPPLARSVENFLDDYFGQRREGDILPFVLDVGFLGREVNVNMGKSGSKRVTVVGEAILSGLWDRFAKSGQYWVGDEDLVDLLRADVEGEAEGPLVQEETKSSLTAPKHPPPAAISTSSSSSSDAAGPADNSSSQKGRSRAISDFEFLPLPQRSIVTTLPGECLSSLKAPEPAHIHHAPTPPSLVTICAKVIPANRNPTRKQSTTKGEELRWKKGVGFDYLASAG